MAHAIPIQMASQSLGKLVASNAILIFYKFADITQTESVFVFGSERTEDNINKNKKNKKKNNFVWTEKI